MTAACIAFPFSFPAESIIAGVPYQLDAAKASNPQSVDDVEVGQVEVEEKGVLCFIPVTPGREGERGNMI